MKKVLISLLFIVNVIKPIDLDKTAYEEWMDWVNVAYALPVVAAYAALGITAARIPATIYPRKKLRIILPLSALILLKPKLAPLGAIGFILAFFMEHTAKLRI